MNSIGAYPGNGGAHATRPRQCFRSAFAYVNPYDRKKLIARFQALRRVLKPSIAHVLSTQLIAKADFVADVHSGDGAEWLQAFVGVYGGPLATDYEVADFAGDGYPNTCSIPDADSAANR